MLLVGDIGGTKTDLAIFPLTGNMEPEIEARFKSADHSSLEDIIEKFLATTKLSVTKAVFGVAGPVVNGKSQITNLPWQISEETLQETFNLSAVKLLNDLEAIGHAVPHLPPHQLEKLNSAEIDTTQGKHKAVIAPGTGLGEAILFHYKDAYHIIASEGGHSSFSPTSLFETELLKYLLGKYGHVSHERVCSGGLGIPNIYNYLKVNDYAPETATVAAALQEATDPTPIIVQAGLSEECEISIATLNAFVSILGTEASNLALKVMALGGVYLAGGIPPRILPKLKDGTFMAAFVNKGRFSDMLSHIPVYVILNKQTPLLGAAHYGLTL